MFRARKSSDVSCGDAVLPTVPVLEEEVVVVVVELVVVPCDPAGVCVFSCCCCCCEFVGGGWLPAAPAAEVAATARASVLRRSRVIVNFNRQSPAPNTGVGRQPTTRFCNTAPTLGA